ncbi:MAG: 5-(carboxyamino)imidazole ribonucleotide synthase [Hyphomicrobiaceae bacterium]|jgi:5-(carboxyamino)imidazole ribonucleotide synthase
MTQMAEMTRQILPGSTLGVLGGGQLGRMFALAARKLGYRVAVFAPDDDTPTGQIADLEVRASYDDLDAVEKFARATDVITFEFENVPAATVDAANKHAPVRPSGALLHAMQDRLREKRALAALGLPVARHATIETEKDLDPAFANVGAPAILKTAAWGYDGKGQRRIATREELESAWNDLGRARAVLEAVVSFEAEISVVATRGLNGSVSLYDPFLNHHANHILDVTISPAPISEATGIQAAAIARSVLEGYEVVGVVCVEMFLLPGGGLVVNEIAPRPHNSGHITIDAHTTSQFEQQVRAICGLPLGASTRRAPAAAMANLLGDLWSNGEPNWSAALSDPDLRLHLYGKDGARPGRKMGHLSIAAADPAIAEERIRRARQALSRP